MVNAASRARGPGDAEPFWPILAVTANKPRSSTDVNTTSHYSSGAVEYATSLRGSTTVVLIDGQALAEYIYRFGLGMQVEQTLEIKKLDADFWDKMQDDA